jgi:hypothetical protein
MPDPEIVQPARAVEQVELVLFAAINVEGFRRLRHGGRGLKEWLINRVTRSGLGMFNGKLDYLP